MMVKKKNLNQIFPINNIMPVLILVLLIIVFTAATGGQILAVRNISAILNQSIMTIIAGLGMIFVVSLGGTDITTGSLAAMAGTLAGMAGRDLGFWIVFPVAIFTGIVSGFILGFINTHFKVSSFMVSLAMLMAIRAGVNWVLNASTVMATKEIRMLDSIGIKLVIVVILIAVIGYIFKYTSFGYYCRGIGENENAMSYIGINVSRIKLLAFMISGGMAAVAGVFAVARNGGANNTMCTSFEMKVMMAMFIASIPVSGGMQVKIYKLIIGTFTIQILESGLILAGASGAITQLVRGAVLIGAVYLAQVIKDRFQDGRTVRKTRQGAVQKG